MLHKLSTDKQYKKWLIDLKQKVRTAQVKAAITVHFELLNLHWDPGREISKKRVFYYQPFLANRICLKRRFREAKAFKAVAHPGAIA
jgi:hypothetical protein